MKNNGFIKIILILTVISLTGCSDIKKEELHNNNINNYIYFYTPKYNNCFNIQKQNQFKEIKNDLLNKYNGEIKYPNKDTAFITSEITGKNVFIFTKSLKSCQIFID